MLRTNTDHPPDEIASLYRGLWRVERAFREAKSTLEVRPIYHQNDDACIGHLIAGFLALRLEVDLQSRLGRTAGEIVAPRGSGSAYACALTYVVGASPSILSLHLQGEEGVGSLT